MASLAPTTSNNLLFTFFGDDVFFSGQRQLSHQTLRHSASLRLSSSSYAACLRLEIPYQQPVCQSACQCITPPNRLAMRGCTVLRSEVGRVQLYRGEFWQPPPPSISLSSLSPFVWRCTCFSCSCGRRYASLARHVQFLRR